MITGTTQINADVMKIIGKTPITSAKEMKKTESTAVKITDATIAVFGLETLTVKKGGFCHLIHTPFKQKSR